MNGFVQSARKAVASLGCAFALAGTAAAVQTTGDEAPGSDAPMVELDEVWVHGKSLARRIEQAEDDFFRLYNALNRDDRFDVHCGDMALHAGSMIMRRTCMPGFVADRLVVSRPFVKPSFSILYSPDFCAGVVGSDSSFPAYADGCGGNSFALDRYLRTSLDWRSSYSSSFASPAPLALEALHYQQQYADTVLEVIQSNSRLQEKAALLAGLYEDLESTQQQYRELKAATSVAWRFDRKLGAPGPRGR